MTTIELNVVFGTGPVGLAVMDELVARGKQVRVVNRSGRRSTDIPAQVEVIAADATDPQRTFEVIQGATVVYNTTNAPDYNKWATQFPPLQKGVLEGAAKAGAKLVVMENLYMYGSTNGQPLTENLPYKATGSRGGTRAKMALELQAAHQSGKIQAVSGRASDFFGARVRDSAAGEAVFRAALAGKKAQVMVSANNLHSFSYIPDVAKGLVTLGENPAAYGQAWHLPTAPAITTRQFLELIFQAAGQPLQVQVMPKFAMKALGLVVPPLQGISELFYEFEEPFVVDHSKFDQAFQLQVTPLKEAIQTTLAWYKAN